MIGHVVIIAIFGLISWPINFNHSKINNEIHNVWEGLTEEQRME